MPRAAPQLSNVDVIRRWAVDPQRFVTEALRVARITSQQREGLEALRLLIVARLKRARESEQTPARMRTALVDFVGREPLTELEAATLEKVGISIMSGQGTGKDAFTAWAILWFLFCFPFPKIPCTAPTGHQLRDVLWSEVHKWMRHSLSEHEAAGTQFRIGAWLTWQSDRIFATDQGGKEWFAVARTANPKASADEQAETLAGFHEDFLAVVIDEASGVLDPVFRPLEATMTGLCNFALMIFNPTRSKGFAVESHTKDRARWICLHWNAEDSEIVTEESRAAIAKKYGKESNAYRVRVKGLPPTADPDTLIPWDWVMDAIDRDVEPLDDDPTVIGIDVGRFGDDPSVILPIRGPRVGTLHLFRNLDTEQLAGWAMGVLYEEEPVMVFVDTIGVGGGTADILRHRTSFTIIDVNVQELPSDDARFHRLRDELWWRVRERFQKRNIAIPNDDELVAELTTPKYAMPDGKIKVQSKKELKAQGKASPNKADALCLTQYYEAHVLRGAAGRGEGRRREKRAGSWRTV